MDYYTNTELVEKCGVSFPTIARWIEGAVVGTNSLMISKRNNKIRILVNAQNEAELLRLLTEGKKYKNNSNLVKIRPLPEFYENYSPREVVAIVNDLIKHSEVKLKYVYAKDGAKLWKEIYESNISPIKSSMNRMLQDSVKSIINLLDHDRSANLFDIGPGNGDPLKIILNAYNFNYYCPVDISSEILDITLKSNFEFKLNVQPFKLDIEDENFTEVVANIWSKNPSSQNFVTFFGNTINNLDNRLKALQNISCALYPNDKFLISYVLDSQPNRAQLKYVQDPTGHAFQTYVLRQLGFDISKFETETKFDESIGAKTRSVTLDQDYSLEVSIFNEKCIVNFEKGQKIKIYKHYLPNLNQIIKELTDLDFNIRNIAVDSTQSNALILCEIKN